MQATPPTILYMNSLRDTQFQKETTLIIIYNVFTIKIFKYMSKSCIRRLIKFNNIGVFIRKFFFLICRF